MSGNYTVVHDRQVVMEAQIGEEVNLHDHVQHSSVAIENETGETVLAFESDTSPTNGMYVVRYDYNGFPICRTSPADDFPVRMDDPNDPEEGGLHKHVSISMRKAFYSYLGSDNDDKFFGAWVATPNAGGAKSRLLQFAAPKPGFPTIAFSDANFGQLAIDGSNTEDVTPSTAMSGGTGTSLAWETDSSNDLRANSGPNQRGLLRILNSTTPTTPDNLIRCCDGPSGACLSELCSAQYAIYQPCIAQRDDGVAVICWAEKEVPGQVSTNFNIALRVYSGLTLIASIDRDNPDTEPNFVNEPERDLLLSDQISPAVDIDMCGNITVVWVGRLPNNKTSPSTPCSNADDLTVYARRLYFDGSTLNFKSRQFRVDTSGAEWKLGSVPERIHPTVALLQTYKQNDSGETLQGRTFIAWNAIHRESDQWSVRGQFFHSDGRPWAREFDVSPYKTTGDEPEPDGIDRELAESNQHTIAHIEDFHTAFATWTRTEDDEHQVWLTKIESQFYISEDEFLSDDEKCVKGDVYADPGGPPFHNGIVDQDDILPFIDILLTAGQPY